MTYQDFIREFYKLCVAFDKDQSQELINIYYENLKDYNIRDFEECVGRAIKENQYFPKIAELISMIKDKFNVDNKAILMFMKDKGYFKSIREYDKAIMWASAKLDQIPQWLKNDMKKYYLIMLGCDSKQIGCDSTKQIEIKGQEIECEDIDNFFK